MEIRWSPSAAADLEHIVDFIGRENPAAARRSASRYMSASVRLEPSHLPEG
jgi:plasmid stabilization system protein ParE